MLEMRINYNMKMVFITNALTPHQVSFCDELYKILNKNFILITTEPLSEERIKMGWRNINRSYEIKQYENKEVKKVCDRLIVDADIVLLGSAHDKNIIKRLKKNKLTFRYSERLYKNGLSSKNLIYYAISAYLHHGRFKKYPLYMLCASSYTAYDVSIFGNYIKRTYKWGYFPESKLYNVEDLMDKKNNKITNLLWVGRLTEFKHAEHAIEIAGKLKDAGYEFNLNIIGDGECFQEINNLIQYKSLNNNVTLLGAMDSTKVREYMEQSNIFLFTSDFREGWGAVLNEAMNCGCAIVASHAAGAVPFLINSGENGVIYKSGNLKDFYIKLTKLIDDRDLQIFLGRNAYFTIQDTWNEHTAAIRFIELAQSLQKNEEIEFTDGPCSRAEILRNDWL